MSECHLSSCCSNYERHQKWDEKTAEFDTGPHSIISITDRSYVSRIPLWNFIVSHSLFPLFLPTNDQSQMMCWRARLRCWDAAPGRPRSSECSVRWTPVEKLVSSLAAESVIPSRIYYSAGQCTLPHRPIEWPVYAPWYGYCTCCVLRGIIREREAKTTKI